MRPDQRTRVDAALKKAHYAIAGDPVTYVDADGTETVGLVAVMWDDDSSDNPGLEIDGAGMRSHGLRNLSFLKADIAAAEITLDVTGHFLIAGERWDFAKDQAINKATVPIAGLHPFVEVLVERAVELQQSVAGDGFTYGPVADENEPDEG